FDVHVKDSRFTDNGRAIAVGVGAMSLDNVMIEGVTADKSLVGVHLEDAGFTMTGGSISNMKQTGVEIVADKVFAMPNSVAASLTGVAIAGGALGISVLAIDNTTTLVVRNSMIHDQTQASVALDGETQCDLGTAATAGANALS